MDVACDDGRLSKVAAAIGEPTRTRMLCCLLDGRARTATELAIIGGVRASTASAHLARLVDRRLVKVQAQGRHRYYTLQDARVAAALDALTVVAGAPRERFAPHTPAALRAARTCYDHMAGALAVRLHDRWFEMGWLEAAGERDAYALAREGADGFAALGVDVAAARAARRRFACACLDWSERRPHLAGGLGATFLASALRHGWVRRVVDSRALEVTRGGRRAMRDRFGIDA